MLLAGQHERRADPPSPMLDANRQPVHVPSPTVPCGDQRTHDHTAGIGNEQAPRRLSEQPLQILESVGGARPLAASFSPQLKDGRRVLRTARAHDEIPVSQKIYCASLEGRWCVVFSSVAADPGDEFRSPAKSVHLITRSREESIHDITPARNA